MRHSQFTVSCKECFAILLLFICCSFPAWSTNHISQSAFWEDSTALSTLQQAQSQPYTPYTGVLSRGFTTAAVWIRLTVKPAPGAWADDNLILRIRPVYLDEIRLYDPLDTTGRVRVAGDRANYSDSEYKSLTHTFVIPAGSQEREVWLRLKTSSTSLINVEALTPQEMSTSEFLMLCSDFAVLSLIAVFLMVVFINWLNYREFLYSVFVARHALYFVFTASFFGFHRLVFNGVIDAQHLDLIYNWLVIGATGFSIFFENIFLMEYSPPSWAKNTIRALLVWSLLCALLLLTGQVHWALKMNMALNAVGVLVLLVVSSIFIDDEQSYSQGVSSLLRKKWVVAYYASIASLLIFSVLPYLGAVAGNEFSVNGLVFYALCSGAIMTVLMQLRANQLRKANEQHVHDLLLSTHQVEMEKVRREEQSQLLTMLMHELKTPLSVIDLAQQSSTDSEAKGYVIRNVAIIKKILDRCLNADRIALGQLKVDFQPVHLRALLDGLISDSLAQRVRLDWALIIESDTLHTDYQCLQIIVSNLLDNALRYGAENFPVELKVYAKVNPAGQSGVAITVANKTGIASWPEPDKVFKKYYRSNGAKTLSGTGLGLFLVASIAKIIGATCAYVPDDTHVRFELWLPI